MEIIPGVGIELAKIGERRPAIEARLGTTVTPHRSGRALYKTKPNISVTYDKNNQVELVEVWYGIADEPNATLDGVQLTWRFLDEVVADLIATGHRGEPFGLGYKFEAGFLVGSNGARWARDLDPTASEDDERQVCEIVAIAPYDYFREPTPEEMEAFRRNPPWEQSNAA